uniref:Endo/exonuclease/phosphatase domain-containing protein n=1 Tax=Schistocephalus solidus TaxID=70667 RepID=A0A183SC82_SCHSO
LTIYRLPNIPKAADESLLHLLKEVASHQKVLIAGDFNAPIVDWVNLTVLEAGSLRRIEVAGFVFRRKYAYDLRRQQRGDLIQTYQIVRGREFALKFVDFFELAGMKHLRGHPFKLPRKLVNTDVHRNTFSQRVV